MRAGRRSRMRFRSQIARARSVLGTILVATSAVACVPNSHPVTGKEPSDPTWDGLQSETVATVARAGDRETIVVTYNDDTLDGKVVYSANDRIVYPGASLLGWSYSFDHGNTFTYGGKVPPPPGYAALWGDPAIVTSNTNYGTVYISTLAIGANKIPPEGHHGWMDDGSITGACIARSDDGGQHFKIQSCFSAGGDFYDGAAMAAAGPGLFTAGDMRVFAAFNDVPKSRIDVWASADGFAPFVQLPDPFPGMAMVSHPRLAYDRSTGALLVGAIANLGGYNFVYLNRMVGTTWGRPIQAGWPITGVNVTVAGQNIRWGSSFSFDVGAPSLLGDERVSANDAVRVLYTTRDSKTQRIYVRGTACAFDLAVCTDAPEWGTTPGNFNISGQQWNPTVKAWPGFLGLPPVWKAAYQSTDDSPNGISLKEGNLIRFPNGLRTFLPFDLVPPRSVCPDIRLGTPGHPLRGYWGDYDEVAMVGFKDSAPEFLLAFSDSSKGCILQQTFNSAHVHVSSVVFQ
jgi:hypothetical protein